MRNLGMRNASQEPVVEKQSDNDDCTYIVARSLAWLARLTKAYATQQTVEVNGAKFRITSLGAGAYFPATQLAPSSYAFEATPLTG